MRELVAEANERAAVRGDVDVSAAVVIAVPVVMTVVIVVMVVRVRVVMIVPVPAVTAADEYQQRRKDGENTQEVPCGASSGGGGVGEMGRRGHGALRFRLERAEKEGYTRSVLPNGYVTGRNWRGRGDEEARVGRKSRKSRKSRRSGSESTLFLWLFCLPFAAVGVGMFGLIAWSLGEAALMWGWSEVPAQVLEAGLDRDSDGGTECVTARYSYEFDGESFTGERVGIHGGSDNFGSYHRDWYATLETARQRESSVPCFVDPSRPERSILDRTPRLARLGFYALFAVIFGGVGLGVPIFSIRHQRGKQRQEEEFPDEPWRRRDDWTAGVVRSRTRYLRFGAWTFAILWWAVTAPILFKVGPELWEERSWPLIFPVIFPIAGVFLVTWAVRTSIRYRKFGTATAHLAEVPGRVGGALEGVICFERPVDAEDGYRVRLRSERTSRSGDDTRSSVVWEHEEFLARGLEGDGHMGSRVPFYFEIPADRAPTDPDGRVTTRWVLSVDAACPGVDLAEEFDVPVFDPAEGTEAASTRRDDPLAPYRHEGPVQLRDGQGIHVHRPASGGVRVELGAARDIAATSALTVVWLVFWIVVVATWGGEAPVFIPIAFGFFGVLLTFGVVPGWLESRSLDVDRHEIVVRRRWLLLARTVVIPAEWIEKLDLPISAQMGAECRYRLVAHLGGRKKVTLATGLKGRGQAETFRTEVYRALGEPEGVDAGGVVATEVRGTASAPKQKS